MLRSLEQDAHGSRLQQLLQRFRAEETAMTAVLHALNAELEHCNRETAFERLADTAATEALLRRCSELQFEGDQLAIELVHVRLAVSGTDEELAEHLGQIRHAGPSGWPGRPIELRA